MTSAPLRCEDCQRTASENRTIHQFRMSGVDHIRCSGCMSFDQFGAYLRKLRAQDIANNPRPASDTASLADWVR